MPKWVKFMVGAFATIGVAYVAMALAFSLGIFRASCQVATAMVVPSPSQSLFARVETQSCDSKSLETIVWVSSDRDHHIGTTSWSVFRAPSAQQLSAGEYAPLQVRLNWLSDRDLEIGYPKGTATNAREGTYNGVKVTFREVEARGP